MSKLLGVFHVFREQSFAQTFKLLHRFSRMCFLQKSLYIITNNGGQQILQFVSRHPIFSIFQAKLQDSALPFPCATGIGEYDQILQLLKPDEPKLAVPYER